jgi:hypothetical protein
MNRKRQIANWVAVTVGIVFLCTLSARLNWSQVRKSDINDQVVDGSRNPTAIPDETALSLILLTTSVDESASSVTQSRAEAILTRILAPLTPSDRTILLSSVRDYHDQSHRLKNESVTAGDDSGRQ